MLQTLLIPIIPMPSEKHLAYVVWHLTAVQRKNLFLLLFSHKYLRQHDNGQFGKKCTQFKRPFSEEKEKNRRERKEKKKEDGDDKGDLSHLFLLKPRITPFLAQTSAKQALKARMGSGRLFMVITSAIGVILTFAMEARLLSPSGDLGIGLVWDNRTGPDHPTTTFRSDCWNPLQTELNYLWGVLSCSQDDIRWFSD